MLKYCGPLYDNMTAVAPIMLIGGHEPIPDIPLRDDSCFRSCGMWGRNNNAAQLR
jgi:hypothetical protein